MIVNPGEPGYKVRYLTFRIDQAVVFIDHLRPIMLKYGDLRDLIPHDPVPGSLYVDDAVYPVIIGKLKLGVSIQTAQTKKARP